MENMARISSSPKGNPFDVTREVVIALLKFLYIMGTRIPDIMGIRISVPLIYIVNSRYDLILILNGKHN